MWDSGLMDEKLGFELSRDDENVLAGRSSVNNTYSLQVISVREIRITSHPPPFQTSQQEPYHIFEARFIFPNIDRVH